MPQVAYPQLLAAVYAESLAKSRGAPTTLLGPTTTVFRAFEPDPVWIRFDHNRQILRRDQADNALRVRDESSADNRWTGASGVMGIKNQGGIYCALQQQAIVNEVAHYVQEDRVKAAAAAGKPAPKPLPRPATLNQKCVIKIRVLGAFIAADMSPHNPGSDAFLDALGQVPAVQHEMAASGRWRNLREAINDSNDCSVARGIGIAFGHTGYEALLVQTARTSERSPLELGDNVIFFGKQGERIPNLSVEEAYLFPLFPLNSPPELYPVQF